MADISEHQGSVDFARLAPAVRGLVMRATLGSTRVDARYREYWRESQWAGIPRRGVYHYFVTEVDGQAQAEHILRTVTDFGTEPVTIDCERRADEKLIAFPKALYTARLERCVRHLQPRVPTGVRIYTSAYEWSQITTQPAWALALPLWAADYRAGRTAPATPPGWDWRMWQYTSTGRLPGIAGSVDLNREHAPPAPDSAGDITGQIRAHLVAIDALLETS